MKLSIQTAIVLIVSLLVLVSLLSLYFAFGQGQTVPLVLVASANIVAVILLTFLITRGVMSPLDHIRGVMKKVGEGKLTERVKLKTTKEIEEVGEAFNDMIERVQRVQDMKTEFVSLAAHQLRTPLTAVKWSIRMLLEGDAGRLGKEQEGLLKKSFQSTDRMVLLINDLLDVARIEEGHYLYQPTLQQIGDVVRVVITSHQTLAERKKIRLEVKIPKAGVPQVYVDADRIQLAIQNLVENALHYTPAGGVVTVEVSHDTKEVKVSVQDTGIGIPEKQQSRVFEKFFRATNARKVDTEGTGLGLYLVYNIVKAHGGRTWFESKEGEGSAFAFSLPLKKRATHL